MSYHIIDEPRVKPQAHLIVNPLVILLVGMLLPLFWHPPLAGRVWMPLLWMVINGYLLGSPHLKQEVLIGLAGLIAWFGTLYGTALGMALINQSDSFDAVLPYLRLFLSAIFFLTLYLMMFKQMLAYELHMYLKDKGGR